MKRAKSFDVRHLSQPFLGGLNLTRLLETRDAACVWGTGLSGMNKLVVNHLDKTIVTSDGATIVQELDVLHPAAKMVVMACQMQEKEAGDGTSLVVTLTGECGQATLRCYGMSPKVRNN